MPRKKYMKGENRPDGRTKEDREKGVGVILVNGEPVVIDPAKGRVTHPKKSRTVRQKYSDTKQLEDPSSKWYGAYDVLLDEFTELYKYGLSWAQICHVFNIDQRRVQEWMERNEDVRNKIESSRRYADSRVVASLYQLAIGGARVTERQWTDENGVKYKEKTLAPSAYAGITWLERRDPAHWANSEVVKRQLKEEFEEMTDQQLDDMIERLLEKSHSEQRTDTGDNTGSGNEVDDESIENDVSQDTLM